LFSHQHDPAASEPHEYSCRFPINVSQKNGVATVDKKHQIVIDAQAFGEGQEHHILEGILETVKER